MTALPTRSSAPQPAPTPEERRRLRPPRLGRPGRLAGGPREAGATAVCVAFLGLIAWLETLTPPGSNIRGIPLVIVVSACWLLSDRGSLAVVASGLAVPVVSYATGNEDTLSAITEVVAVALMALIVRATVRAIGRADARRREHAESLLAVSRSLERFTADAAHELRAPLAVVQSEIDLALDRERSVDEYRARLRAIEVEVGRMRRLSDALLTLARADAGALQARLRPVDLADLLELTSARWRVRARERNVGFVSAVPDHASLVCDADLIERVLDNLLDNALRHVGEGGQVALTAERDGDAWMLRVHDTGPGIPDELRPVVFDRFVRGRASRPRGSEGAGLGLAVCAAIVAAHHGSITLDPGGPGARFTVRLPADRPSTG